MSPKIMKRYLRLRTAREIWNALPRLSMMGQTKTNLCIKPTSFLH
ncbi:hypothetical protein Patl1_35659 [Pistacia atlantica]|nr:hypothetical protein Patl1_35659 [Pistacia atlantica]